MNLRLCLLPAVLVTAIVVACGATDDTPSDGTADAGAGGDGSLSGTTGDGAAAGDGAPGSGSCNVAACAAGRKCDATLGCVECVGDSDCTAVGRDPFCILGRCEACRTNADCGVAAPSCYPADHRCHRTCGVDGGLRCPNESPKCDATTGACFECAAASDCPATRPICDPTTKSCVACGTNADCPATKPACAIPAFQCAECVPGFDCADGRACSQGRCVAKCAADADCKETNQPHCNTVSGICVRCQENADCSGVAGAPLCLKGAGRCVSCLTTADCGDGGTPFCDREQCVQCRRDQDCPGPTRNCNNGLCR